MTDHSPVVGFYTRWAWLYDVLAQYTPGLRRVRQHAVDALAIEPGTTVVEMGCGTGANIGLLQAHVGGSGRVVGIDVTPRMLRRAQPRHPNARHRTAAFIRGDAGNPPITSADAVLATFVIGMLQDPSMAIDRWCDLLPTGGRIVLVDASPSDHRLLRILNPEFRAFVRVTAPRDARRAYPDPVQTLEYRIEQSRSALADHGSITQDKTLAYGFLRLTTGVIN